MLEFSSNMFALQKATNEAIKETYKNHNLLFQAQVRSSFSKWTGMNFLTATERKNQTISKSVIITLRNDFMLLPN